MSVGTAKTWPPRLFPVRCRSSKSTLSTSHLQSRALIDAARVYSSDMKANTSARGTLPATVRERGLQHGKLAPHQICRLQRITHPPPLRSLADATVSSFLLILMARLLVPGEFITPAPLQHSSTARLGSVSIERHRLVSTYRTSGRRRAPQYIPCLLRVVNPRGTGLGSIEAASRHRTVRARGDLH
ncbi:hypothetical protein OH77DRAFT_50383 [Trametes cingulata]|nr:hypothetical protein OH77DRAFT_50383 [Trametes cingulata]